MIRRKYIEIGLKIFLLGCIIFHSFSLSAQELVPTIKGRVLYDGKPLSGITVSVVNGFTQTLTETDGSFSIKVQEKKTLLFSGKGYEQKTVVVDDAEVALTVDMRLATDEQILDYGYQSRSKTMSTAAISSVNGESLSKTPVATVNDAVQGTVTGLTAVRTSGNEPGWSLSDYYVRGIGTFGNSSPLILVDNVERDITLLEPEEIESFSVLKDAAALVKYGMHSANGVINIKTKRGYIAKPEVSFKANFGIQTPSRLPEYLGSQEYVRFRNIALANDGLPISTDPRYNPDMYNGTENAYLYPNTDWYGEFIKKTAPIQSYRINVAGGTDIVRYYVLLGITNQQGLYNYADKNEAYNTNPDYTRYNIRANTDINITKYLTLSLDLGGKLETKTFPNQSASNIITALAYMPPTIPILNQDGSIGGASSFQYNPYGILSHNGYSSDYNRYLQGNVSANYKLDFWVKGLAVNVMYGFDTYKLYRRWKTQSYAVSQLNLDGTYTTFGQNSDVDINYSSSGQSYGLRSTFIGGLNYETTIDNKHALLADLKYRQSTLWVQSAGANYNQQDYLGSLTYGFDKRYIAEFAFSYSGSEDFSKDNRFDFFPTASLAWIASNEGFMKNVDAIDLLKLRASYGVLGNSNLGSGISRYPFLSNYYNGGGYIFGDSYAWSDGSYEGRLSNPNIKNEISKNLNIGLDVELLKNKLEMNLDFFRNDRSRIITTRSETMSGIVGQTLAYENIGSVLNKGFELMLKHQNRVGEVGYFAQANVSFARNKITYMDEVQGLESWLYKTGQPVGVLRGLEAVGFFNTQEEIDGWAKSTYGTVQPGDVKYVDQNNDNIIDENDFIPLGYNNIPEWNFGLNFGFNYKNFDLTALFTGVANRSYYVFNNVMLGMVSEQKVTATAYDTWQKGVNESSALLPRLTTEWNNHNTQNSTIWKQNGNYLRLQSVELGYNLPKTLLAKANIKDVRVFVNGYNLFSFDHLKKYNLSADYPNAGVYAYPELRVYNVGVNIKF
ncbi:MAG: SusC/RagA family TonB-linked outer membrane protein [Dysgonomonas sp.]